MGCEGDGLRDGNAGEVETSEIGAADKTGDEGPWGLADGCEVPGPAATVVALDTEGQSELVTADPVATGGVDVCAGWLMWGSVLDVVEGAVAGRATDVHSSLVITTPVEAAGAEVTGG